MRPIATIQILCLLSLITSLSVQSLHAKNLVPLPPSAPVPAQILSAKRVFISNGGAHGEDQPASGGPNRAYNELYASMQAWGHYELVAAPADADLIFETRVTFTVAFNDRTFAKPELELTVLDPKTHVVLWTCIEPKDNGDKGFNKAMDKLMSDIKQLVEPAATAPSTP